MWVEKPTEDDLTRPDRHTTRYTEPDTGSVELLAVRCQLGEPRALDELVERWHVPIWKYVRRMAADEHTAEEVHQEVWLRIVRGLPDLRDPSKLVAWMFRIARYACLDRMRDRYSRRDSLGVDTDVDPDRLESDARHMGLHVGLDGLADEVEELLQGLLDLPTTEREVLTLFYLRELDLRQVAEVLEVPAGTVKSRLFRARKMLRDRLETATKGNAR